MKKHKFPVLQRFAVEDFDMVKLDKDTEPLVPTWAPQYFAGTWTLQKDGFIFFHLPHGLIQATVDFTEEEVAAMLFDAILSVRNDWASIGNDFGRKNARQEIREALGIEEVER